MISKEFLLGYTALSRTFHSYPSDLNDRLDMNEIFLNGQKKSLDKPNRHVKLNRYTILLLEWLHSVNNFGNHCSSFAKTLI